MSLIDSLKSTVPSFETVVAFHTANVDALVKANAVLVDGIQAISSEVVADVTATVKTAGEQIKAAYEVRAPKAALEHGLALAKSNLQTVVANGTKFGDLSRKIVTDAFAPVTARFEAIVKTAA